MCAQHAQYTVANLMVENTHYNSMLTEPGDILDISELNEREVNPKPSLPPSLPEPEPLPDLTKYPDPDIELPGRPDNLKDFRRKRKSNLEGNKHNSTVITNFHVWTRPEVWKECDC